MRQLTKAFKIAWPVLRFENKFQLNLRSHIPVLINFQDRRNLRSFNNVELKRPEKYRPYDPVRSGDLEPLPNINPSSLKLDFNELDEIKE